MTDKKRKAYGDTYVNLGEVRCEWLRRHGGKQPTIRRLIDAAMFAEGLQPHCGHPVSEIVCSGEGTCHCSECERAAQALGESPGPQAQAGEVEE